MHSIRAGENMKNGYYGPTYISNHVSLNRDQQDVFNLVVPTILQPRNAEYTSMMIEGATGTGKTFLLNTLISFCEINNLPYISMAYTRMASLQLRGARTVYSRFKMPWSKDGRFVSYLMNGSQAATELYDAQIIIWDQVTSCHKGMIAEVDIVLQRLMKCQRPFGGKVVLLAGDFRECLPIVEGEGKDGVENCIKYASGIWPHLKHICFTKNMRFKFQHDFDYVNSVGIGREDHVAMPEKCQVNNNRDLIEATFGRPVPRMSVNDANNKIILTLTNVTEKTMNRQCLNTMNGYSYVFDSMDNVRKLRYNEPSKQFHSLNYFNPILPNDFPAAQIDLKLGAPIVLKRWHKDLQPGTRLVVMQCLGNRAIRAMVVSGPMMNQTREISRMKHVVRLNNQNLEFRRYQLPVSLCFAMTVHKAQGLNFTNVGLALSQPVFSHGQLYMAVSRVTDLEQMKIHVYNSKKQNYEKVPNVVCRQVLTGST